MRDPEPKPLAPRGAGGDCYAILGLQERYAIDKAELEANYLARSKSVHPDRFVNAPAAERVAVLQQSMQLNEAYKTLKRPLPRAEYLLTRRGVAIGDNEILDPAFLMEVLELREELQEARHAGDRSALRRLEDAMLDRQDAALADLAARFAKLEKTGDDAELEVIKKQVIQLRYIARYLEDFADDDDDDDE